MTRKSGSQPEPIIQPGTPVEGDITDVIGQPSPEAVEKFRRDLRAIEAAEDAASERPNPRRRIR